MENLMLGSRGWVLIGLETSSGPSDAEVHGRPDCPNREGVGGFGPQGLGLRA